MREFLIDTNILVYTHDPRDRRKKERALDVMSRVIPAGRAVLSVQCLTEFFNSVRRRLPDPMPSRDALLEVERLARVCRVLDLTPAAVLDGCRACNDYQISFWDAMIWAVARANGVDVVLSEDFDHDRVLEGVRFLNPFVEAFDMALLET